MLERTLNQCMNFRKLSAKRHVSWLRVLEHVKEESEIQIEITHAILNLTPTKFKTITSRTHDMSRVSVGMFVFFL